jgi:hypothetical protein
MIWNVDDVPNAVSKVETQLRAARQGDASWPNLDVDKLRKLLITHADWGDTLVECANILSVKSESFQRIKPLQTEITDQMRKLSRLILERK